MHLLKKQKTNSSDKTVHETILLINSRKRLKYIQGLLLAKGRNGLSARLKIIILNPYNYKSSSSSTPCKKY